MPGMSGSCRACGYARLRVCTGMPGLGRVPGHGTGRSHSRSEEMDDLIERIRRRLKYPLHCVLLGVRGPQEKTTAAADAVALGAVGQLAADDQQKAEITKIVAALDAIVKATDQHEKGLAEMLKQVREKTRELEALLPNVAVVPEKPAADEALPGASAPADASAPTGNTPPAGAGPPAGASDPAEEKG